MPASLRPAWTPLTIFLMVLGFIIWWPLGLAMLAYIIWGDRLQKIFDDARAQYRGAGIDGLIKHTTGNTAFDSYRRQELDRLEQERKRIDEEAAAFEEFMRNLRRAKDQEEFERFKAQRRNEPNR